MRTKWEIMVEVLELLKEPQQAWDVVRLAGLGWSTWNRLRPRLMARGFIHKVDGKYLITEQGEEFLNRLKAVFSLWEEE